MPASKRTAARSARPLGVGSRVTFVFGVREVLATVIEDRGHVGHGGRRLLRVRLEIEDLAQPIELEVPEADVTAVAA